MGAVCAGKDESNNSKITITGGTFIGKTAATVNYGEINIKGGSFEGSAYALATNSGSLNVYDGEFYGATSAYSGNVTTTTDKVIVGGSKEAAANWDRKTSLNSYRYVAIGEFYVPEPAVYHITYSTNGGTIANESNYTSYTEGTTLSLPTPARTGYTFGGWYTNASFTGATVTSITATDTWDKTYYAKWTAKTYTVTLNPNGGSGTALTFYTYGAGAALPTDWTRTGYTFAGWYDNAQLLRTARRKLSLRWASRERFRLPVRIGRTIHRKAFPLEQTDL